MRMHTQAHSLTLDTHSLTHTNTHSLTHTHPPTHPYSQVKSAGRYKLINSCITFMVDWALKIKYYPPGAKETCITRISLYCHASVHGASQSSPWWHIPILSKTSKQKIHRQTKSSSQQQINFFNKYQPKIYTYSFKFQSCSWWSNKTKAAGQLSD